MFSARVFDRELHARTEQCSQTRSATRTLHVSRQWPGLGRRCARTTAEEAGPEETRAVPDYRQRHPVRTILQSKPNIARGVEAGPPFHSPERANERLLGRHAQKEKARVAKRETCRCSPPSVRRFPQVADWAKACRQAEFQGIVPPDRPAPRSPRRGREPRSERFPRSSIRQHARPFQFRKFGRGFSGPSLPVCRTAARARRDPRARCPAQRLPRARRSTRPRRGEPGALYPPGSCSYVGFAPVGIVRHWLWSWPWSRLIFLLAG